MSIECRQRSRRAPFQALFFVLDDPTRHFRLGREHEKYAQGAIKMLILWCNHCNEMITGGDFESTDQIVGRLDKHLKKCFHATFTFEGTTAVAVQRLEELRSCHEDERPARKVRLH